MCSHQVRATGGSPSVWWSVVLEEEDEEKEEEEEGHRRSHCSGTAPLPSDRHRQRGNEEQEPNEKH